MRKPAVIIVLLVLLGLVPVGAWGMMALSLEPVGLGRSIGKAILAVTALLPFAGGLMTLGAVMFKRTRRAGRILATIGAGIVGAGAGAAGIFWLAGAGRCVEAGSFCTDRLVEGGSLLLYAIAHVGMIVLIWRARRGELSSAV